MSAPAPSHRRGRLFKRLFSDYHLRRICRQFVCPADRTKTVSAEWRWSEYTDSPGVCDCGAHSLCAKRLSRYHRRTTDGRENTGPRMDWGTARSVTCKGCDFRSGAPLFPDGEREGRLAGADKRTVRSERAADDRTDPDSHPLPVHAIEALGRNRRPGVSPGHRLILFLPIRRFVCAWDGFPVPAPLFVQPLAHDFILPQDTCCPGCLLYECYTISQAWTQSQTRPISR